MKPQESLDRSLMWTDGCPIYVFRRRKSDGERYIEIRVHHPKGNGTETIKFSYLDYGDEYEMKARKLAELLSAACDNPCILLKETR